jgi:catechol 2,3-dioxygenase-like lactoylglutathione lyase family enzyme
MKLTELRPMLWTESLQETIDFYTTVLGFTADEVNDDWGWASLSKDAVGIMLTKPNAHTPYEKTGFTGSFYFNVEDIDVAWEDLKDKARVCYGIENFEFGMREFAIYDNNGYILQFGREIER